MTKDKKEIVFSKKTEFRNRKFEIFLRPDADESVVAEIFKWQEYKSAEEIIKNCALPILDVGAHIGIFSLYAKAINAAAKIYALEPEENNFDLLKQNVAVNNLSDVKIFKVALAGKSGSRDLKLALDSINHHLLSDFDKIEKEDCRHEKVSVITLGDFLRENNIGKIGLIKMDIEGGEYEIFESLSAEDFSKIGNVILEYHNYFGRHYQEIENILRKKGFGVQIFPSRFEKDLGFMLARNKRFGK